MRCSICGGGFRGKQDLDDHVLACHVRIGPPVLDTAPPAAGTAIAIRNVTDAAILSLYEIAETRAELSTNAVLERLVATIEGGWAVPVPLGKKVISATIDLPPCEILGVTACHQFRATLILAGGRGPEVTRSRSDPWSLDGGYAIEGAVGRPTPAANQAPTIPVETLGRLAESGVVAAPLPDTLRFQWRGVAYSPEVYDDPPPEVMWGQLLRAISSGWAPPDTAGIGNAAGKMEITRFPTNDGRNQYHLRATVIRKGGGSGKTLYSLTEPWVH